MAGYILYRYTDKTIKMAFILLRDGRDTNITP